MISDFISGKNAERDRQILRRRLIDGITYERLAEEFDLSVTRIQRILYEREIELLRHISLK
jgi:DNA-directed RNA polymerase specialized sigma24 family protein